MYDFNYTRMASYRSTEPKLCNVSQSGEPSNADRAIVAALRGGVQENSGGVKEFGNCTDEASEPAVKGLPGTSEFRRRGQEERRTALSAVEDKVSVPVRTTTRVGTCEGRRREKRHA